MEHPIDDSVDVRTNQRAELLQVAAIEGVFRLGDVFRSAKLQSAWSRCKAEMVVATDSEYICKEVEGQFVILHQKNAN